MRVRLLDIQIHKKANGVVRFTEVNTFQNLVINISRNLDLLIENTSFSLWWLLLLRSMVRGLP